MAAGGSFWGTDVTWIRRWGERRPALRRVYWQWELMPYRLLGRARRLRGAAALTVLFFPDLPRHDHKVLRLCLAAGWRISNNPEAGADYVIAWQDRTVRQANERLDRLMAAGRVINGGAIDISKRCVDRAHLAVFGYALAVDPTTHVGPMARKADANAVHDGVVVEGPIPAGDVRADQVYQYLVDSRIEGGLVEDLRLPYFFGAIPLCHRRPVPEVARFSGEPDLTTRCEVADVVSMDEVARIDAMMRLLGIDVAELDAVRDRPSDRLYVLDANPTAAGPSRFIRLPGRLRLYLEYVAAFEAGAPRYR